MLKHISHWVSEFWCIHDFGYFAVFLQQKLQNPGIIPGIIPEIFPGVIFGVLAYKLIGIPGNMPLEIFPGSRRRAKKI